MNNIITLSSLSSSSRVLRSKRQHDGFPTKKNAKNTRIMSLSSSRFYFHQQPWDKSFTRTDATVTKTYTRSEFLDEPLDPSWTARGVEFAGKTDIYIYIGPASSHKTRCRTWRIGVPRTSTHLGTKNHPFVTPGICRSSNYATCLPNLAGFMSAELWHVVGRSSYIAQTPINVLCIITWSGWETNSGRPYWSAVQL